MSAKRWGLYGGIAGLGAAYYMLRNNKSEATAPASPSISPSGGAGVTTKENLAGAEKALDPNSWRSFKLVEKSPVTHNTYRLRFAFPDSKQVSGLTTASCLLTKAPLGDQKEDGSKKPVIRPYTPENLGDQRGFMDLVVKGYPQGLMSKHIVDMQPGDELEFKGPIGKLPYEPNMKKKMGMVAGGSGLTPMLQVIKEIARNPQDTTEVSFVFANQTVDDIILKKELDDLSSKHRNIKPNAVEHIMGKKSPTWPERMLQLHEIHYLVDKPPEGGKWDGGVGYLTKDLAKDWLPEPSTENMVLVCGPPPMMKAISGDKAPDKSQGEVGGVLAELGYTKDQVYKF